MTEHPMLQPPLTTTVAPAVPEAAHDGPVIGAAPMAAWASVPITPSAPVHDQMVSRGNDLNSCGWDQGGELLFWTQSDSEGHANADTRWTV